jgi:threonyl-tRNA synthetase
VGEKEVEAGTVSLRRQGEGDQGAVSVMEFVKMVQAQL